VPDPVDNCPDEPGLVEHQGCQAPQRVTLTAERIDILEAVFFRTNAAEILSRSFPLLENVARVLQAHPEITRVIVEGHTDSRGRRDRNITLSQQRAEAVVRFLVERGGVDAARLEARGFGPDRPRVENARTPDQHAQNRRVEFNIPGGSQSVRQGESEAGSDTIDR
jgi:outer membrane protein OmpA-like peptidoglycan-associated protein